MAKFQEGLSEEKYEYMSALNTENIHNSLTL